MPNEDHITVCTDEMTSNGLLLVYSILPASDMKHDFRWVDGQGVIVSECYNSLNEAKSWRDGYEAMLRVGAENDDE